VLAGTFDERLSGFGNEGCPGLANASKYGKVKKNHLEIIDPKRTHRHLLASRRRFANQERVSVLPVWWMLWNQGSIPSRRRVKRNGDHG